MNKDPIMKPAPVTISHIDTEVDRFREIRIVALRDGIIVGTIGLMCHQRVSACVRQLFVAEEHRREGIGTRLMQRCIHLAREAGCSTIGLQVDASNIAVMPFYQRLGFHPAYQYENNDVIFSRPLQIEPLTAATHP